MDRSKVSWQTDEACLFGPEHHKLQKWHVCEITDRIPSATLSVNRREGPWVHGRLSTLSTSTAVHAKLHHFSDPCLHRVLSLFSTERDITGCLRKSIVRGHHLLIFECSSRTCNEAVMGYRGQIHCWVAELEVASTLGNRIAKRIDWR